MVAPCMYLDVCVMWLMYISSGSCACLQWSTWLSCARGWTPTPLVVRTTSGLPARSSGGPLEVRKWHYRHMKGCICIHLWYLLSTVKLFIAKLMIYWWSRLQTSDFFFSLAYVDGNWGCFIFLKHNLSLNRYAASQNQERSGCSGEAEGVWWYPPTLWQGMLVMSFLNLYGPHKWLWLCCLWCHTS